MDADIARKNFELANNVVEVDPQQDHIYRYDRQEHSAQLEGRPWTKE
jgi:hypothetical protein